MISLRKAHPAFRMTEKAAVDEALDFATNVPDNLVEYVIQHHANGDNWKNILVIYNGSGQSRDVDVKGDWIIVANDKRAGLEELQSAKTRFMSNHFPSIIAHTDGAYRFDPKPWNGQ